MGLSTKYISNKAWDKYKRVVQDFMDIDAGRQVIYWYRHVDMQLPFGEDLGDIYIDNEIEALCYYNAFRNWPINRATNTGELDEENLSLYVSAQYLYQHHYTNSAGYWDINPSEDRFLINGILYKPSGDTQVAQAKDIPIAFILILKRDRDTLISDDKIWDDGKFRDHFGVWYNEYCFSAGPKVSMDGPYTKID